MRLCKVTNMAGKLAPAQFESLCSAGKHKIEVGQNNYYEKVNEKWIRCTDLECFKSLGGSYDPNEKPFKKGRSVEMSLAFMRAFDKEAWEIATKRAKEIYPDGTAQGKEWMADKRAIATESLYRTLVEAFNGK